MNRDALGPVGGLAADRPVISNMVLAFGLTALAASGVEAKGAAAFGGRLADLMLAAIALAAAPLAISGFAPSRPARRAVFSAAILAAAFAFVVLRPAVWLSPPAAATPIILIAAGLAASFVFIRPFFGAPAQLGFVSVLAALLGAAGGAALFMLQGAAPDARIGAAIAAALAAGSTTGLFAVAEFAAAFARGGERRASAAAAAQDGAATALFAGVLAAAAFAFIGAPQGAGAPEMALFAGAAALLAATASLVSTVGALALRRPSEAFAAEENRRREAFRRFWRPIRLNLPASSAYATVAIVAIAIVAAAFGADLAPPLAHFIFIFAAGASAGLIFFSLRVGVFVFFMLLSADYAALIAIVLLAGTQSDGVVHGGALAYAGFAFGQLAIAWREARSPRLNPRETTEAAMAGSAATYILCGVIAIATFHAAAISGMWPGGAAAAGEAGVLLAFGIVFAPPLMTALSGVVRRELA